MRRMRSLLLAILGFSLGCQTQFIGDAHIDPATCQARCTQSQLVMAGMVYMGAYSSACLCEVPRPPGAQPPGAPPAGAAPGAPAAGAASGSLGAAGSLGTIAGVMMQMQAATAQGMYQPAR
jgi:hypothetical protein